MNKKRFIYLFLTILILNLVWEFSHNQLYFHLTEINQTLHLILASFGDVFWIFLAIGIISILTKKINWTKKPTKKEYLLLILITLIIATLNEIVNLNLGRWSYLPTMPTIFGIGLSPLIQLTITGILSIIITNSFTKN